MGKKNQKKGGGPPQQGQQEQGRPQQQQGQQQQGRPQQQGQQQQGRPQQQGQQQQGRPQQQGQQQQGRPQQQGQQEQGRPQQQGQQQQGRPQQQGQQQQFRPQQQGQQQQQFRPQQQGQQQQQFRPQQQGQQQQQFRPQQQGQQQQFRPQQQGQQQQQFRPQQQGQQQFRPQQQGQQQQFRPQQQGQQQQFRPQQQGQQQQFRPQQQAPATAPQPRAWGPRPQSQPQPSAQPPPQTQQRFSAPAAPQTSQPRQQERQQTPPVQPSSGGGDSGSIPIQKIQEMKLKEGGGDTKQEWDLALAIPKRADRPRKENRGRKIIVETNHLALRIGNIKAVVHHYDVSFDPEKPVKFYREAFVNVCRKHFPKNFPAFDGKKNIYSYGLLPIQGNSLQTTVTVMDPMKNVEKEVKVKIQYANPINLETIMQYMKNGSSLKPPQEAIQAIDIVLRQPAAKKFCQVGRSFFKEPGRVIELGDGLQIWYGFFQSAIIGSKSPYLNVDVAHRGFPMAVNCVDALQTFLRDQINESTSLRQWDEENFNSFMRGLKIVYTPPSQSASKKSYKVGVIGPSVKREMFQSESGKISVYDYFLNQYKYRCRFPNLPTIKCGPLNKFAFPIELCEIVKAQVVMKKLNEKQTAAMVKLAATAAPIRKAKIVESIRDADFNRDQSVQEFQLSVAQEFTKVEARILDPPELTYNNQVISVRQGVWKSGKFINAPPLEKWAIYSVDNYTQDRDLNSLAECLTRNCGSVGMSIQRPSDIRKMTNPSQFSADMSYYGAQKYQIVFVVIADRGPITYARVKQEAELRVGLLTQCIRSNTLRKLNPATGTNILLKLNAKLNGVNHSVEKGRWPKFFAEPVIVFGADVTHPSHDQPDMPSVAAVVASHDPKAFKYNTIWRVQGAREEIITDLENIVREQLLTFFKQTGYKPLKIMFFRDGVSEGQFKEVIEREVMAIRRACKRLQQDYEPPVTFIVVQKRHHTRLFPNKKDADGRNENVPAGTVVDTDIIHPTEFDFYLVSHASIQGTSRPTKYHVLCDDSKMSEDDLQEITYYLCHLFTRCTRSVSYPAPTYYAHLAAFRVRSYIDRNNLAKLKSVGTEASPTVALYKNNPMYFV